MNLKQRTAGMSPQELFNALKKSSGRRGLSADLASYDPDTNPTVGDQMPDYSEIMSDSRIWELTKFLLEEAIDTNTLYDITTTGAYPTGSITYSNIGLDGDAANGDATYANRCAFCHGADGTAIPVDGSFSVGSFVRKKPYEVHHKVKFGQPGTSMGSLLTHEADIRNMYKALTNVTKYPDP